MMDAERNNRIVQLVQAALALTSDERTEFLVKECDIDRELWREVESLLQYEHEVSKKG